MRIVFGKVALKMQIYSGDTVAVQSFIYIVIRESLLNIFLTRSEMIQQLYYYET